jgi:HPt (histidine-containing phosphotransfer) domain-containing protein
MATDESLLDIELLDENVEIGLEGLIALIHEYFIQADELSAGLKKAVSAGSAGDVGHLAHKFAGSSAVCGLKALVDPLRDLEKKGDSKDLQGAEDLLDRISNLMESSRRLLAEYLAEKSNESEENASSPF